MVDPPRINTYKDFWPYYLREHARPQTRAVHYLGTGLATGLLIAAVAADRPWLLVLALIAGYGPAWFGHFFIENNKPATFSYPMWSLFSDYRMAWAWLTGHLSEELAKAGIGQR